MESGTDLAAQLSNWIKRLKQVDAILEQPVQSLIRLYADWEKSAGSAESTLPAYVTAETQSPVPQLLIHAIACGTIERLCSHRRRYQWLSDTEKKQLAAFQEKLPKRFLATVDADPLEMIRKFEDGMFGALNPLTASEILSVLIKSGERHAHRGAGFLMLFSIFWSLFRKVDESRQGARLDPWRSTASITARCLAPVEAFMRILERRATLYRDVIGCCKQLEEHAGKPSQRDRWRFTAALEKLSLALHDLADVAINGDTFMDCAHAVAELTAGIDPRTDTAPIWNDVRKKLTFALRDLCKVNREVLLEATTVREQVIGAIVDSLTCKGVSLEKLADACTQIQYENAQVGQQKGYWTDLRQAATEAAAAISHLLTELKKGAEACDLFPAGADIASKDSIAEVLGVLERTNDAVALELRKLIRPNLKWIRLVMIQEIAYASAGDSTFFDPAELLSSIVILERWDKPSTIELCDAIRKVVETERRDGSWATGQPIYLIKRVLGVWPKTPDILSLLVSAVGGEPEIDVADEAIFRSVGWLEKMQLRIRSGEKALSGWSSEVREDDRIDLWTTCTSINTLLEVRDLIEHRLWEICEQRFVVRREIDLKPLDEIDPVDLGAVHERRLHHRLMRMARETADHGSNVKESAASGGSEAVDYSFLLHGPPGSSKTAIAEAVGREMWSGMHPQRRFVRITPADFTRGGEAQIDAEARFIFDLLMHVRGVTLFFDEIDDLLRSRAAKTDPTFIKLIIPAMLNRLQDLRDAAPRQQICFLLATNYVDNIEPALTRPGRIDAVIPVPYPDAWSRENLLERYLEQYVGVIDAPVKLDIIEKTMGWPWSTFKNLCKRLRRLESLDPQMVRSQIEELESEFERSDRYYFDPERWRTESRPLTSEFIHTAMSLSQDKAICAGKITDLLDRLEKAKPEIATLPDFDGELNREWKRQGRP